MRAEDWPQAWLPTVVKPLRAALGGRSLEVCPRFAAVVTPPGKGGLVPASPTPSALSPHPPERYVGHSGPQQPIRPATNGMAVTSLVCPFLVAPLAIVFGHVALSQIKRSGERGRELAIAGVVLGYLFTVLSIVAIAIAIYVIYALGQGMYGIASLLFMTPDSEALAFNGATDPTRRAHAA